MHDPQQTGAAKSQWSVPGDFEAHIQAMLRLSPSIPGYLSEKEVRFLCQLALVPSALGEFLEIGSFRGKSTVLIAKSLERVGATGMHAVDPLCPQFYLFQKEGEPQRAPRDILDGNLQGHHVERLVEFHQMTAQELSADWNRPLRVLWIDGDHSYAGTKTDFDCFARHLAPGGIIAFHDVLHGDEGPVRVFHEQVLLSPAFGACGLTGSIGWAQFLGDRPLSSAENSRKRRLARKLSRLIPFVTLGKAPNRGLARLKFKLLTALVPHAAQSAETWVETLKRVA